METSVQAKVVSQTHTLRLRKASAQDATDMFCVHTETRMDMQTFHG